LEALFLFQFPIYGFCLTIEQAYKKNLVRASAKAFQGEDTARWSGGHVIVRATSKEWYMPLEIPSLKINRPVVGVPLKNGVWRTMRASVPLTG
jgi:hypothetical protein